MEKRKSKLDRILFHFDEITEENLIMNDNLEKIINQVFSAIEYLKKYDSMKEKEVYVVYKFCLDVLRNFTEMNSTLKSLIDENPLKMLNCIEQKFMHSNDLAESLSEPLKIESSSLSVEAPNRPESEVIADAEAEIELYRCSLSGNSSRASIFPEIFPDTSDIGDEEIDFQSIKKNLREVKEKFGLNEHNLSEMKGFYEKPSSTFNHSTTVLPDSFLLPSTSNVEIPEEIPEKDTNTSQDFSQSSLNPQIISKEYSSDETVKDTSTHSSSPLISFSEENTDLEIDFPVIVPVTNVCQNFTSGNIDNGSSNPKCTALEKLNNYRAENIKGNDTVEDLLSPDIKLKPAGTVIQNFIPSAVEKKSKKKKSKNKEKTCYELISKETPSIGQECVISHVESPSEFYIHLVDDCTELIDDLNDQINDYCTKHDEHPNYGSKEETLNDFGRFCIAYIAKQNMYYRAQIINGYVDKKHDDVLVQLMDYGNKKLVNYKNLRKLTDSMSQLPILAVRCHFPLLYPPESTYLNRLPQWPTKSIEALLNISGIFGCDNKTQFFKIVYANQEGNSVAIDLYNLESGGEENTLGQVLLDTGLAVQIVDDYDENNMELERYLEDVEELEAENINEAVMGYDPRDEARICRFTKPDGTCFKGKNCKLEHVPLSKDGFTTDKEQVFSEAMYPLILPQAGTKLTILITGYIDSCRFFAQIINKPYKVKAKYIMDHELYLLYKEMNSEKIIRTYEQFKIPPALGEIVLVKHFKNWTRGIVRELELDDNKAEAEIFVLDTGEYIKVPIKGLRKIMPHYLKLPFQSVEFYIHNYEMDKDCPKDAASKFFHQNLYFKNFTAYTMSSNPPLKVRLTNMNGLIDVGETIAVNGYAVKRVVDMNIHDDSFLDLY